MTVLLIQNYLNECYEDSCFESPANCAIMNLVFASCLNNYCVLAIEIKHKEILKSTRFKISFNFEMRLTLIEQSALPCLKIPRRNLISLTWCLK